jgi:hypothetical protein
MRTGNVVMPNLGVQKNGIRKRRHEKTPVFMRVRNFPEDDGFNAQTRIMSLRMVGFPTALRDYGSP